MRAATRCSPPPTTATPKRSSLKRNGGLECHALPIAVGNDEEVQTVPNSKFISNKISNKTRRTHRCMKQAGHISTDLPLRLSPCIRSLC